MNATNTPTTPARMLANLYAVASDTVTMALRTLNRCGHSAQQSGDLGTVCLDLQRIAEVLLDRARMDLADAIKAERDAEKLAAWTLPENTRRKVIHALCATLDKTTLAEVKAWCEARQMTPPATLEAYRSAVMLAAAREGIVATQTAPEAPEALPIAASVAPPAVQADADDDTDTISPEERAALADETTVAPLDTDRRTRPDDVGAGLKGLAKLHALRRECKARKINSKGTAEQLLASLRADEERRTDRERGVVSKTAPVVEVKRTAPVEAPKKTTPAVQATTNANAPVDSTAGAMAIAWKEERNPNGTRKLVLYRGATVIGHIRLDSQQYRTTNQMMWVLTVYHGAVMLGVVKADTPDDNSKAMTQAQSLLLTRANLETLAKQTATPVQTKKDDAPKAATPHTVKVTFDGWTAEDMQDVATPRKPSEWQNWASVNGFIFANMAQFVTDLKSARAEWKAEQERVAAELAKRDEEEVYSIDDEEEVYSIDDDEEAPAPVVDVSALVEKGTLGSLRKACDALSLTLDAATRSSTSAMKAAIAKALAKGTQSAPPTAPKASKASSNASVQPNAGKANRSDKDSEYASKAGLPLEHYRVLRCLVEHGRALTYGEIKADTGYYPNLTRVLSADKPESLSDYGYTIQAETEGGKIQYQATAKGRKLIATVQG
jgi:hypothetical protein